MSYFKAKWITPAIITLLGFNIALGIIIFKDTNVSNIEELLYEIAGWRGEKTDFYRAPCSCSGRVIRKCLYHFKGDIASDVLRKLGGSVTCGPNQGCTAEPSYAFRYCD